MVQTLIVAVLVTASALYAAWLLMPRTRLRMLQAMARRLDPHGSAHGVVSRLISRTSPGGCGGCAANVAVQRPPAD